MAVHVLSSCANGKFLDHVLFELNQLDSELNSFNILSSTYFRCHSQSSGGVLCQ